jgi:hypothetical protein
MLHVSGPGRRRHSGGSRIPSRNPLLIPTILKTLPHLDHVAIIRPSIGKVEAVGSVAETDLGGARLECPQLLREVVHAFPDFHAGAVAELIDCR